MKKCLIEAEYDPIPPDGPEFDEWVKKNDKFLELWPLNSGRRLWSGTLRTYLRGCDAVLYIDGAPVDFVYQADLKKV